MASFQATLFLVLVASRVLLANSIGNAFQDPHNDVVLHDHPAKISTNVTFLSAPYFHKVSAGAAWIIPTNANDLGARDNSCECFNPSQICCPSKSHTTAGFCIPGNSTCCSDAFCNAGETCCGDSCCPAGTTCNLKTLGSGCCPKGNLCSSPPICYDHSSANCRDTFFPAQQCCPSDMPFCRSFPPNGLGCYTMESLKAASTTVEATLSPGFPVSPAFATSPNATDSGFTATRSSTQSITETITVINEGSNSISLAFPATTIHGPPFPNVVTSTTFVFSSLASSSPESKVGSTSSQVLTNSSYATPTASTSKSMLTSTATSMSTLCFNIAGGPAPCTTSSTSAAFAPAGASIVSSQATCLLPPSISLDQLRSCAALLTLTLVVAASGVLILSTAGDQHNKAVIKKSDIQVVEGSARKLRGRLSREIKDVEGSARKLRGRLDREIKDVQGSGRVLRGTLSREIKVLDGSGRVLQGELKNAIQEAEDHVGGSL